MLIVDDLLFGWPVKTVRWVLGQLQRVAEEEMTNEQPVHEAILENELALEEGRIERAVYEERQAALMARLREVKELKRRLAEERPGAAGAEVGPEPKPVSGRATLEVDADLEGYGKER
jgi:hypothetical protein